MAISTVPRKGQSVTRAQLALNRAAGVKHCYRCDGTKPFAEFAASKGRSDGLNPICRSCTADYRRERTARDPEWQKRQSAKSREANSEKLNADARARYHADIERARALNRAKQAANPERYREHARRFREQNREKCNEASKLAKRARREISREADREYRVANKDKIRERHKAYYEANRETICERGRVNRLKRLAANPELVERQRASVRRYHAANPDKCRDIRRNRKARIRGAEGTHTAADVAEILVLQSNKCAHPWCRVKLGKKYDVDHIVAIARGGTNDRRNLQILCRPCNAKKWAKDAIDVARENGLLI